jgi:hypothetical protein
LVDPEPRGGERAVEVTAVRVGFEAVVGHFLPSAARVSDMIRAGYESSSAGLHPGATAAATT